MSLISDALKEAQRKRGGKKDGLPSLPAPYQPERKRKKQRPLLGLTIFAILLLFFSVYFYIQMEKILKIRNRNTVNPSISQTDTKQQKPFQEEGKKELQETLREEPGKIDEKNFPGSYEERGRDELKISQPIIPQFPIQSEKKRKEKKLPEKLPKEKVSVKEEEKKDEIEIIRSFISSKKSSIEEELLEIERLEKTGEWGKACSLWEKIIEGNKKKEYFLNAGVAYKNKGDWKRAEELFLKAIELDPHYLTAMNNLGVLYLEKKEYDKAIDYLLNALKLSPSDPEINVNIGIALFKKNEFKNAQEYFEKSLKIKNDLYQSYYYLGIIYLNQNEREKALSSFLKLLELAPDDFPPELKRWVKGKIDSLRIPNP